MFVKLIKWSVLKKGAQTRHTILEKAFELSYRNGFQNTSVDDIIGLTTFSKSTFFYHFKNKEEMGLAMIKEIMHPGMHQSLIVPLYEAVPPIERIYKMMKYLLMEDPIFDPRFGCPAVNIIEEMAPINERFKKAISRLIDEMVNTIEKVLSEGKAAKQISKQVDVRQTAHFIVSGYMGIRNLGKLYGSKCYNIYLQELKNYLNSLK